MKKMHLFRRFVSEEAGSDIVEYTLLLAFVALSGAAIWVQMTPLTRGLWQQANNRLTCASN
jgi:Flp pilus assembly pilin Flp